MTDNCLILAPCMRFYVRFKGDMVHLECHVPIANALSPLVLLRKLTIIQLSYNFHYNILNKITTNDMFAQIIKQSKDLNMKCQSPTNQKNVVLNISVQITRIKLV